jgi:1-acyl-sn-glycerol-3-phosphate acyltransferase
MKRRLATWLLALFGWRAVGRAPEGDHFVLIGAPHTSNWDMPLMLAFGWVFELNVHWLGKKSLFDGPLGWLYRWTGGLPVDRSRRTNLVDAAAALFDEHDRLTLVISPEGTRARADHWKSGFYWIARRAGVPILPSYLDWATKTAGFGPLVVPTDSVRADMDALREVYRDKQGRHPEDFGPVRLSDEDAGD